MYKTLIELSLRILFKIEDHQETTEQENLDGNQINTEQERTLKMKNTTQSTRVKFNLLNARFYKGNLQEESKWT